jgi:hypothetical protein
VRPAFRQSVLPAVRRLLIRLGALHTAEPARLAPRASSLAAPSALLREFGLARALPARNHTTSRRGLWQLPVMLAAVSSSPGPQAPAVKVGAAARSEPFRNRPWSLAQARALSVQPPSLTREDRFAEPPVSPLRHGVQATDVHGPTIRFLKDASLQFALILHRPDVAFHANAGRMPSATRWLMPRMFLKAGVR